MRDYGPFYSKLYDAIEDGNQWMANSCLQEYESNKTVLTRVDIDDLFQLSCLTGNLSVAKYLYHEGAALNARDSDSQGTAIVMAAAFGKMEVVRWLIDRGVDVTIPNNQGTTALHFASRSGSSSGSCENIDIVSSLINAGADVNAKTDTGETPLCQAAHSFFVDTARLLLSNGADKNIRNNRGTTALETITELVDYLPHVSAAEKGQMIEAGFVFNTRVAMELIKLLSQEETVSTFNSLLLYELDNGKDSATIRELLLSGANPNQVYDDGCSVLYVAVEYDLSEVVKLLINAGANVNAKISSGHTPLHYAIEKESLEIIQALLFHGADPNIKKPEGVPTLYCAVLSKTNGYAICEALINAGAEIDSFNASFQTPLHLAAEQNKVEIVRLLIEAGADVNHVIYDGAYLYTPLSRVIDYRDQEDHVGNRLNTIDLLLSAGATLNTDNCDSRTAAQAIKRAKQASENGKNELAVKLKSIASILNDLDTLEAGENGYSTDSRHAYLRDLYSDQQSNFRR